MQNNQVETAIIKDTTANPAPLGLLGNLYTDTNTRRDTNCGGIQYESMAVVY